METEETHICFFKFYRGVMESSGILHIRKFVELIKNVVKELRADNSQKIVACEESDQHAYFFQYGVLHSVVSGMCFQDLIYQSQLITKGKLKVCVLGGGPGFEAVSLCKVVNDMPKLTGCEKIEVNVAIIEPDWDWNDFETNVFNSLRYHKEELFDSRKVELKLNLLTSDLSDSLDEYTKKAVRHCQIFTVVTRPSVKTYDSTKFESKLFKEVLEVMRPGSFLCSIDYTGGSACEAISKIALASNFNEYNLPSVDTKYTVDLRELNLKTLIYGEQWNEVMNVQSVEVLNGAWKKGF